MEPSNSEPANPEENPENSEAQIVRVKRRRRRSKQEPAASVPLVIPKKTRGKSIWRSAGFWAAMNVVTAAVTYICVKWSAVKSATEVGELKTPPAKHATGGTEPVEEVPPAAPAVPKPKPPEVASFFAKPNPERQAETSIEDDNGGLPIPKTFHPETLPRPEATAGDGEQSRSAARAKAEMEKAAKFRDRSDFDHAIESYREAVRLDPNSAEAAFALGQMLEIKGRIDEAIVYFFKAMRLNPNDIGALTSLAWISATNPNPAYRNGARAVDLAERARKISEEPGTLDTLAAAYAEAGRFKEAAATAQKAIDLAQQNPRERPLVDEIKKRLALYQSGKPFHGS